MNSKTSKPKKNQVNYYNLFPENRDFYFLNYYEEIKDFKNTNFEDPDYICVISEDKQKQIKENIYFRKDFLNDYEFIKVINKYSNYDLKFIIGKNRINKCDCGARILSEIKKRPLIMKEILRNVKINFNTTENIYFKEEFSVPTELKFFSKIVKLYIHNLNYIPIPQNQKINTINNNIKIFDIIAIIKLVQTFYYPLNKI